MLFKLSTIATVAAAVALASTALMSSGAHAGGGGPCEDVEAADASTTTVALRASCFAPTVTRIEAGDTVTFTNEDHYLHEIHGAGFAWGSTEAPIYGGESFTQVFAEEGIFPYACYLHPGMSGAIVVGDGENETATRAGAALVSAASGQSANPTEGAASASDGSAKPVALAAGIAAALALLVGAAGGAIVLRLKR